MIVLIKYLCWHSVILELLYWHIWMELPVVQPQVEQCQQRSLVLCTLYSRWRALLVINPLNHSQYFNMVYSNSLKQVMFRKVIGDPPVQMVAFTFTVMGLINLLLCWPITLGLYLSGAETMPMDSISWIDLLMACILMLGTH